MIPQRSVILYSSLFPKPSAPHDGMFTAQLAIALNKMARVHVVCPVPWRTPIDEVPASATYQGLRVHYPRFFYIPFLSRPLNGVLQAFAVLPLLKRLVREESVELINAHFLYPDGVSAAIACRVLKLPLVVTALGSDINVLTRKFLFRSQIAWACRSASGVSAVSLDLTRKIVGLGVPATRVAYTPNGVNVDLFTGGTRQALLQKLSLPFPVDTRILVFVGRLHTVKGLDILLKALSQLRLKNQLDFHTLLVGEGPEHQSLTQYAEEHQIKDQVTFVGAVDHESIPDWLGVADVFCLPSRMEGQPNAILEALASGLPVVASAVGGIPDLITDENGVLFAAGDSSQLVDALSSAFSKRWDRESIRRSIPCESWEESAENYLALFKKKLQPRAPTS